MPRPARESNVNHKGWRNEDPEPRVGGGEAEKKKVTSPILMAEVVVDVPNNTRTFRDWNFRAVRVRLGLRAITSR